jgi:2-aminoadipate transaminase
VNIDDNSAMKTASLPIDVATSQAGLPGSTPPATGLTPATLSPFSRRSSGQTASAIREILKVTEDASIISFAGGLPAPELFPAADLSASAAAVLASDGPGALQYGTTEGYRPLREWVCGYLKQSVGLVATPEQIVITAGSQQGLDLIGKILLDPGDTVIAENPAFLGAMQAFRSYEAKTVGLPTDREGMDPDALWQFLRESRVEAGQPRPKLLYLVSNFQNPTGLTTSLQRRRELAKIASEFAVTVVEDDPYGVLRFEGEDIPALSTLPGGENAIYLGTVSKMLAPGLRVAWLVARDPKVKDRITVSKQACDLHTSSLNQRMVDHFVRQPGRLEAHVAQLRQVYRDRRDIMLGAMERHLPAGAQWTVPEGGLFLWVKLADGTDATALLRRALERKVAFVPGAPFWLGKEDPSTLRLNFSNATPERIEEGMRRLGEALRRG